MPLGFLTLYYFSSLGMRTQKCVMPCSLVNIYHLSNVMDSLSQAQFFGYVGKLSCLLGHTLILCLGIMRVFQKTQKALLKFYI